MYVINNGTLVQVKDNAAAEQEPVRYHGSSHIGVIFPVKLKRNKALQICTSQHESVLNSVAILWHLT